MKLCYYVSLATFGHKVLKCAGQCPNDKHREFYEPYFRRNGDFGQRPTQGPFTVLVLPYQGDKVRLEYLDPHVPMPDLSSPLTLGVVR